MAEKTKEQVEQELLRLKKQKELQDEINKAKAELEYRKKNFSIRYYAVRYDLDAKKWVSRGAHKSQDACHRDKSLIRVASGGNRSGKSTFGVNEGVSHALGYRPWLPEGDPDRKVNVRLPNKGLVCGESFGEQIAKVLVPKLLGDQEKGIPGAIPTDELSGVKRNPTGVVTSIFLKNGSAIYLQSYDQDIDLFESADYDWCIEEKQRVLLSDGRWKEMREMQVGDNVVTVADNGRRNSGVVSAVHDNGVKPLLRIKTRNGHEIDCTANHRIWVVGKGWVEAGDVLPGMVMYRPVLEFDGEDTLSYDDCFWIGVMIGDGWTSGVKSPHVAVASELFIDVLKKRMFPGHELKHRQRYDYKIVQKGRKNHLKDLLYGLGLWGKRAHEKFIPTELFKQSREARRELLRGLFATDGWVGSNDGIVGYASTSKRLAEDVKFVLASLGIQSGIFYRPSKVEEWRDQWHVYISQASEIVDFCETIGIPSKEIAVRKALKMKRATIERRRKNAEVYFGKIRKDVSESHRKCKRIRQQHWVVKSVEPIGSGHVYDLTVDGGHNYICQGFRVHNCHFDEPPPRPIWVAVQRGLTDRRGRTWLTMTPLKEPWIYDEIFSRDDVGLYYFDIEENVGFGLTREGVDNFAKNLTDDEKEARLRGKYFHLSGLVYKNYGPKLRLKRFPIPKHWGLWFHVDTHPRTPHHAVWIAVDPDGRKYVCGELKNGDPANSVKPFIEAVKVYEKTMFDRKPDEVVRLIEPGSQAPDPLRDGRSICDEFTEQGLRCRPGSKNRDSGILLFQQELRNDPTYGVAPNIFFFSDLEGVHFEMMHYMWDDWNRKAGEGKTEKQAPKDRYDHFIEGIHRILLDEPFCEGSKEEDDEPYEKKKSTVSSVTGY